MVRMLPDPLGEPLGLVFTPGQGPFGSPGTWGANIFTQIYLPWTKYSSREGLSARGGRAGTEADPPPDTPGMAGSRLLPLVRVGEKNLIIYH